MSGKSIEYELQRMQLYIGDGVDIHPSAGTELHGHLARIEEELQVMLEQGRWRQLWFSSVFIATAGIVLMLIGLLLTVIVSWRSDVRLLHASQQTGDRE